MALLAMRPVPCTEKGRRENNEDAVFASSRLAAVADGVGGAAAGEVASRLAIHKMIALDKRRVVQPLHQELGDAVIDANAAIDLAIFHDTAHAGMGTTLAAVAISNEGDYLLANVGDSRIYLLRGGVLQRLTRDDSLVQELIDRGVLREDEARRHPQRSVLLAALDGTDRPRPAIQRLPAHPGDRLLLCSDGLSDYVCDSDIAPLLKTHDPHAAAQALIRTALNQGSRDNISVVVADLVPRIEPREGWLDSLPALPAG